MSGTAWHTGRRPSIWAVGGGKGGTGKSLVAASLGIHLARTGQRVVLVDGDLGAPNLHTVLGLGAPEVGLGDFLRRGAGTLAEVLTPTGVPNLSLASGARNSLDADALRHFQKTRLLRMLLSLDADVVLLDLGAGTSLNVLDLFALADRGLLVILPEPTSIENAYRFLRAAWLRRLHHLGRALGYDAVVELVTRHRGAADDGRPVEVLDEIARIDPHAAETLRAQLEAFVPELVINQAHDREEEVLGESMSWVAQNFLRLPLGFAGAVPQDAVLAQCVKRRRPYLLEYPRTRTAATLRAIAVPAGAPGRRTPVAGPWVRDAGAWGVLGLPPTASQQDILRSYLSLRRTLRSDAPALAPLACEAERRQALERVEAAYRRLSRNLSIVANRDPRDRSVPQIPAPAMSFVPRVVTPAVRIG